jgi:hypothetical protein
MEEYIPKFDGDIHFATQHVTSFLDFVSRLNVMHEDVLIRLFVYSLEGDPRTWIKSCCRPKEISSLTGLIQVFLKNWDPTYEEDQDDEINEDFDEAPQDSIEGHAHERHVDEESTQTSMPSFHEDKGLVSHDPPQILNLMMHFLKIWRG